MYSTRLAQQTPWRRYLGTPTQAVVQGGTAVGGAVTGAAIAGASLATAAVTAGIGAGVGIILSLISAHNARVKGAKNENAAVGILVPNAAQQLQAIAQQFSAGSLTTAQAIQLCQQVGQNFQQQIQQFSGTPGVAWTACSGSSSCPCNKSCTAGCCVYYNNIVPWVNAVSSAISAGGGTAQLNQVYGSPQYGFSGYAASTIKVTAPPAVSVAGATNEINTVATDITSGATVAGIPVWALALLGAGAAFWAFSSPRS